MAKQDKPFMSIEEVADLLGVNYQLIYRLVRSGELRAARIGRVYRVAQTDLDAYLEQAKSGTGSVETPCASCARTYRSDASFPGACEECGAPICTDCWLRVGTRRCREHSA